MKTKLFAILLFASAASSNVFAVSASAPLNGTYASNQADNCVISANTPPPTSIPNAINDYSVGQYTFTPDTTAASFSAWATSLATQKITNPSSSLNITQDPTTTSVLNLVETPIQWGVMTMLKPYYEMRGPLSISPVYIQAAKTHQFVLTSFTYSTPANNNGVKTGYALYKYLAGNGQWLRSVFFPIINKTTGLVTSGSLMNTSSNGTTYIYNCVGTVSLTQ